MIYSLQRALDCELAEAQLHTAAIDKEVRDQHVAYTAYLYPLLAFRCQLLVKKWSFIDLTSLGMR